MFLAVTFRGEATATARTKYVTTAALRRERRGLAKAGDRTEANVANSRCVYWAGRLFALCDGAKPHQMDPLSVATQKLSELGGALADATDSFEGWARIDAAKQRLVNAKVERAAAAGLFALFGAGDKASSQLAISEFDSNFKQLEGITRLDLARGDVVLDWCVTASSYVGVVLGADGRAGLVGRRRPGAGSGDGIWRVALSQDEGTAARIVNAYDDANGRVVMDVIYEPVAGASAAPGRQAFGSLVRLVVDAAAGKVDRSVLYAGEVGGCAISAAERSSAHSVIFAAARNGAMIRVDSATGASQRWAAPAGTVVGAPTLAGDANEFVLCLLHAPGATSVAVFDAAAVDAGPVGTAALRAELPRAMLDGPFVSSLRPTLKEVQSAEVLARLYARKSTEWNEIEGGFSGLGIKTFLFPKGVSGG
ncbi:hypothetical protein M885DRAFT_532694 [Pelagophyceae sp. CCMP2097]|nr:hypothetical protein M885DRAFT_532694 [Pelagophyceae sp. CCMP2097]